LYVMHYNVGLHWP